MLMTKWASGVIQMEMKMIHEAILCESTLWGGLLIYHVRGFAEVDGLNGGLNVDT